MGTTGSGEFLNGWAFPAVMLALGTVAAAAVASLPQPQLDLLSWRLWLPHVLPAATPPVGLTGRILLAVATLVAIGGIGALPWIVRRRGRGAAPAAGGQAEAAVLPWLAEEPAPRRAGDGLPPGDVPMPAAGARRDGAAIARVARLSGAIGGFALARLARRARPAAAGDAPVVRRADSHPDAPPRRPIMANEDLGPPLPIFATLDKRPVPEPERPLPADLDLPLAAFDPHSVPAAPREPVRAVPPLAVPPSPPSPPRVAVEPDEPVATAGPPAPVRPVAPAAAEPLAVLLERLERGAGRRAALAPAPAPAASLDETLGQLRRLATG